MGCANRTNGKLSPRQQVFATTARWRRNRKQTDSKGTSSQVSAHSSLRRRTSTNRKGQLLEESQLRFLSKQADAGQVDSVWVTSSQSICRLKGKLNRHFDNCLTMKY